MPKRPLPQFNQKDGKPFEITISDFSKGTMTLVDEARIPQNAVYQSTNMMLDQDGVWRVRYGSQTYGQSLTASAISLGPQYPATVTDMGDWGAAWTSPNNVKAADSIYAASAPSNSPFITNTLALTGFGFSIPTGATITGIVVEISRKASISGKAHDAEVGLLKGNRFVGANKADLATSYPTTNTVATYGSSIDLWNTAWSPADINDASFGITFNAQSTDGTPTISIDFLRITVYYTTLTQGNFIDGIGRATVYNTDGTNTNYLFALDNGTLKYCRDGGSWTSISGKTWAVGYAATLTQVNSRLYINNGHDNLAYLDLTTMTGTPTLVLYTALSTPGAVTLARVTLTSGSYNVYYKITAVKAVIGETAASAEATITVNKPRSQWKTDGSEHIDLSWSAVTGADSYNIYYSDTTGQEVWIASTSGLAYSDTGTDTPNPYQAAPPTDGTAGPPAATMRLSGNRIWMTGNPNLPYRIYWSGVGQYLGSFNPFYGGGYIDLNLGGDEKPVEIEHYRDGKGNQTAVVLTSSPTGGGSVWFISLTTLTVDVITVVVPSALSQGTIGTTSARGVVQAQNNVIYPSIKGFQSIGSAQQILNVLVTSEVSTSIRPSVQGINNQASNQIAGVYYYGRIYWSVPFGSSTNNQVWVLDLERQAWCIYWNIGVKQFMEYTDSTGTVHLLGVPVAGNNLIEFGSNILGDSGNYFPTLLKSGLITWDKSHFEFAWVEKVYFELGRPKGNIQLSVSGTAVNKNLESLKTTSITDTSSTAGVGSDQVGSFELGTSNNTPTTYSQSSVKKVLYINKPLNNLEWQIVTNDVNASYSLISITIVGNILPSGDPSQWRK